MTDFQFTDGDKISSLWLRLRAHLEKGLAERRRRNDDECLTPYETAVIRGQIKTLKSIIGLGADDLPMTGQHDAPRGASTMGLE